MTEGPTAGPDGGIYFSYISGTKLPGQVLRFEPKTGKTTVAVADSHKSNGLKFTPAGLLVACEGANYGGRCISTHDLKTGKRTVLCSQIAGKPFNSPNDLVMDRQGRIYFTDPRYGGPEPQTIEKMSVYRVLADGTAELVTENVEKPNGIALSPDEMTLYVADTNNGSNGQSPTPSGKPGAMKVYAFPLNEKGLPTGDRRTVYDFGTDSGCDGLTVDGEGRLYITCRNGRRAGVMILHPQTDREIAFIPTAPPNQPADTATGLPSNVCWGHGEDSGTLYITIDVGLYSIDLRPTTQLSATP